MRAAVAATRRPEVVGGLGGFASAMALPAGYREPLLVSSTDGVGTKTAIAMALGRYDTIGQDLVAMCADDLVCAGAEPLFFLDYVAVGRVFPERVAEIVGSIADGCRLAGCSLIGGETAEHPGLMEPDEFDLAGFCVGVVERDRLIDGTAARAGRRAHRHRLERPPLQRLLAGAADRRPERTGPGRGLRRAAGPDPRPGDAARAGDGGLDAGRGSADADAHLLPGHPAAAAAARSKPGPICEAWPTSPAAACRATCRGSCPMAWRPGSIRQPGRCRRSCG